MAAIPGDVDTAQQPPMTVPLRHFLVGLVFLLTGSVVVLGATGFVVPPATSGSPVQPVVPNVITAGRESGPQRGTSFPGRTRR